MSSVNTTEFSNEQPAATATAPAAATTTTTTTTAKAGEESVPSVKCCPAFNYKLFKQDLHPKVRSLIYYDNPVHTGIAVGAITLLYVILAYDLICIDLLWLTLYVAQWVLLASLTVRLVHQLYCKYLAGGQTQTNIVREKLEPYLINMSARCQTKLPTEEQVAQYVKGFLHHVQLTRMQARGLFLCDSVCVSTTGLIVIFVAQNLVSWFSLTTLAYLAALALFTLPKVYDTHQAQIDEALGKVWGKCGHASAPATTKITAKPKKAE